MDSTLSSIVTSLVFVAILAWALRLVNWAWLRPKKLEKYLKQQGLQGNPYRLLRGDIKEYVNMAKEAKSTPISLSDDVPPHALPYLHHTVQKYGKRSYLWLGPTPWMNIMDPELVKEIFSKPNVFHKPHPDPVSEMVLGGLANYEDDKWAKHRKIINPAFHTEKLKYMATAIYSSCEEMVNKWEMMVSEKGWCEVDVWPFLEDLSGDMISRTAFGSSYEEGTRIFQLQKQQVELTHQLLPLINIPGWRLLPINANKRRKEIGREMKARLREIVSKREKGMQVGDVNNNDLLGILMESNLKEIQEHGNNKQAGMSIEEVMEECKLFYFAGSETTSNLLVWTMVLLSRHPEWQARAREEIFQVFGSNTPDFDGLNHLKIVTMILYEVLRLYPPAAMLLRATHKDTKLGNMILPAGLRLSLPIILLHQDPEIWGDDAKEFKPERFSEGISKATKGQVSFFPFGWGPRTCIGQNFAMIEAKMAMVAILQRFSFEISPSYIHVPLAVITLQPQYGAQMILHKL